jgi:type IV secretion system protein VirB9
VRRLPLVLVLAATVAPTLAAVVPPPGAGDPRVREIDYDPAEVVSLTGYLGYHLHLELAPEETFVALGAGDSAAVDIAAEGPHVMLKPKAARVATNLTLISSRRVYHFEYRTYEARPPAGPAIFALRFRYAPAAGEVSPVATSPFASVGASAGAEVAEPAAVAPRPVNRDYWFCGSLWLRPVAVSDDGVQTRLTFDARGEWPAIFVANADGSESLVNFHAEGTTAVVHRVVREFVLRRGTLVACVENRGYAGSGQWVASGTIDSAATREIRK